MLPQPPLPNNQSDSGNDSSEPETAETASEKSDEEYESEQDDAVEAIPEETRNNCHQVNGANDSPPHQEKEDKDDNSPKSVKNSPEVDKKGFQSPGLMHRDDRRVARQWPSPAVTPSPNRLREGQVFDSRSPPVPALKSGLFLSKKQRQFYESLANMLRDLLLTDITLSTGLEKLEAHRVILAARSPTLEKMFIDSRVDFLDMDKVGSANVLQELLDYFYFGDLKSLSSKAEMFLLLAYRYELPELMTVSERQLITDISVENVLKTLILADKTGSQNLKMMAVRFANLEKADVIKAREWSTFARSNHKLMIDLFVWLGKENRDLISELQSFSFDPSLFKISNQVALLKRLDEMYQTRMLCDVTLRVGHQRLEAHKVVLAAHSPVFGSMFGHVNEERLKPLYMAGSLEALAEISDNIVLGIKLEKTSVDEILTEADSWLLVRGKDALSHGDEEQALVLLRKFLSVMKDIKECPTFIANPDRGRQVLQRFGDKKEEAFRVCEHLKSSLQHRYQKMRASGEGKDKRLGSDQRENAFIRDYILGSQHPQKDPSDKTISCESLFKSAQNKTEMLIIDIRSADDFSESHIDKLQLFSDVAVINIDSHLLKPGITSNELDRKLRLAQMDKESLEHFMRRSSVEKVVIVDWCSSELIAGEPTHQLYECLWKLDPSEFRIKTEPVLLKGGYRQWLDTYSKYSSNLDILLNKYFRNKVDSLTTTIQEADHPVPSAPEFDPDDVDGDNSDRFRTESSDSSVNFNEVKIAGVSFDTLKSVVDYLYSDRVDGLDRYPELYRAAVRFQLPELKSLCEKQFAKDFSVDTITDTLVLAEESDAIVLKHEAQIFILRHKQAVIRSGKWPAFFDKWPRLVAELFVCEASAQPNI